jgi:hypothetical protein
MGNSKLVLPTSTTAPTLVPGDYCYYASFTSDKLHVVLRDNPDKWQTDITGDEDSADRLNAGLLGLDDTEVMSIITSSMAASEMGVRS